MTDLQRLNLRASEIRTRLNELSGTETLSDEQTAEVGTLTTEYRSVETKIQAATVAGDEPAPAPVAPASSGDPETRERAALVARCSVGEIVASAVERRHSEGAELELQTELGLDSHAIPLELLRVETRAAGVTTAPGNTGAMEQPVVMPIFATGDAAYMGAQMPTVASGDAVFPVLTDRPTVGGPHADSTDVPETAGTFAAEMLAPQRIQAAYKFRRTDRARFRGMDSALRSALSSGLSEGIDKQFMAALVRDLARTDAAVVDTDATYRNRLIYSQIDGRFARQESDLRMLVGDKTLADMAALFRGNNTEFSTVETMRRLTGGIRVSTHIAAVASQKQDVFIRRGSEPAAVIPLWDGVQIIVDEVSGSGTGEIEVTAILLANWKVIRTAGFAQVQAQHA